jgi:hypothetical protein
MHAMNRPSFGALFALALCACGVARAQNESNGVAPSGATWRIAVPAGWETGDGLVLVQHGFSFDRQAPADLGPLRDRMLADGYAVAASGYRQRGWALFTAMDDNAELLEIFRARHGEPGDLVAAGGSMGGLIALKLAEDPRFRDRVEGVLALCPVADGVASWDQAFDLRLAYDALCDDVSGGDLPRGAEPTPWALDLEDIPSDVDDLSDRDVLRTVSGVALCTGLGIDANLRTSGMRQRLGKLKEIAETESDEALEQQLAYAIFGLSDLLRAPDKLDGENPFFNRDQSRLRATVDLDYDAAFPRRAPAIDQRIARVERDAFDRLEFHRVSSLDGSASARIVSLHTGRDPIVPVWHQRMLQSRYGLERSLVAVADESAPTHCGFNDSEIEAGWDVLSQWTRSDARAVPTLVQLQSACAAAGAAAGCRFVDLLDSADFPGLARLRTTLFDVLVAPPHGWVPPGRISGAPVSGLWTTAGLPSQALMFEELDQPVGAIPDGEQRVAVYWYTWDPTAGEETGHPRWLVGVGRSHESSVFVEDVFEVVDGGFAAALDPARARSVRWGSLQFDFTAGVVRYEGPPAWGSGERAMAQLTTSEFAVSPSEDFHPLPGANFQRIGSYYDPAHPGQGWVLNQYFRHAVESVLLWYTFDSNGRASWMVGTDSNDRDGLQFEMTRAVQGGSFEQGVAPVAPNLLPWGDVTLETNDCDVTAVAWRAATHGYGDGRVAVRRLTAPYLRFPSAECPR